MASAGDCPDQGLLEQFLQELQFPLATMASLLEVLGSYDLPATLRPGMATLAGTSGFLAELVADYHDFTRLEADRVRPTRAVCSPLQWLDRAGDRCRRLAKARGCAVLVEHRSFLPDAVELDEVLAGRALEAVVRTACHRGPAGPLALAVAYEARAAGGGQIVVELRCRGGGFDDFEREHAFAPFVALDAAARPTLALAVAQRLARLLGGDVSIAAAAPTGCTYRLLLRAPVARGAMWLDPESRGRELLGGARSEASAGALLLVCPEGLSRMRWEPLLRRLGFRIEVVDSCERAAARLTDLRRPLDVLLFTEAVACDRLGGFMTDLREAQCPGVILFAGDPELGRGADAALPRHFTVQEFGNALTVARLRQRQSELRKATSAS